MATLRIIERHFIGQIPIIELKQSQIDAFLRSITNYSRSVIEKLYSALKPVSYTHLVNFSAPASPTTPAGSAPSSVVSYLPIGQYASGQGWGSAAGKFAGKTSLESTGVSLGELGGYIEFKFDDGITDDPTRCV